MSSSKQFIKRLTLLVPMLLIVGMASPVAAASSQICGKDANSSSGQILTGVGETDTSTDCSGSSVTNLTASIVGILSLILGIVAIIVIILAGLRYITSGGDSGKVSSAKTSIIYALIGVVIAATAQILVHFAVHTAAKATTTSSDMLRQAVWLNLL